MRFLSIGFVSILACLIATPASAMDVCRYSKVTSDSFDGESRVVVPTYTGATATIDEDGAQLTVRITGAGVQGVALPPGWAFTYALEDGTKVSFFSVKEVAPKGTAYATQYSAGVYTSWSITSRISAEAAHAIANSNPVAIRYSIGNEERTTEYAKNTGRVLSRSFACVAHKLDEMASEG